MDDQAVSHRARNYALGVLVVVYAVNFVDRQILSILLPAIKAEFEVGDAVLGFLAGPAFAIFYATLGIPIAMLADRYSRRNIIAIALAIWSAMTALSGMASNIVFLAMARVGVGIGEAGCSPPAHSMLADYYPPEQRSTAMGIYTSGISVGIMIAFLAGGWVVENIGWREAFFIVGLPGLALALVVRFTVQEPPRGMSEDRADAGTAASVPEVWRHLMQKRSFLHIAIGCGLASFAGYTSVIFFPSFLVRSHEMGMTEVGLYLGLIYGIGGALGFAGGGYVADRVGRHDRQKSMLSAMVTMLLSGVIAIPVYLLNDSSLALTIFFVPVVLSNMYLATMFAQVQGMVKLRMRAVASAILLLILNLIGLAIGPQLAGILSDVLSGPYGIDSMRYTLLIVSVVIAPWAALHFYFAGKHIVNDLAQVENHA